MPKVSVRGIDFHYLRVGGGPDIVMVHGLNSNLAVWHLKIVPELRRDYRITTYDLRGHGHSDMPPTGYTTRHLAEDLRGIMDALGIDQAHLVGHSLGADIALHFALLYPPRVGRLILVEPGLPALVDLRKRDDWEGWAYWAKLIEEFTGIQVPREKWNDFDYMVRLSLEAPIIYGFARGRPRKKERTLRLLETTTVLRDYEVVGDLTLENLGKIPHPSLLVYDDNSPYLSTYRVLRDLLTNCIPLLLPSSDHKHFSPLEQPELLIEHVKAFLQTDASRAASAPEARQE